MAVRAKIFTIKIGLISRTATDFGHLVSQRHFQLSGISNEPSGSKFFTPEEFY
ncbi:MAG: hypothetical protein IPN76_19285 [Saprospiraceae bacterium]|nr:hypothetical protein [Saprospiraceae bacterium]